MKNCLTPRGTLGDVKSSKHNGGPLGDKLAKPNGGPLGDKTSKTQG